MAKIAGVCREVIDKTEWLAIVTWGEDGPHLVATWGDNMRKIGIQNDMLLLPAGKYYKTEENLKKNSQIQLLAASRQVQGTFGSGQGCRILGKGEIQTKGKFTEMVKAQFPWARAALVIKIEEVKVLI